MNDNLKVRAAEGLLRRAIANILRNAIRYAGDAGPIEIVAEKKSSKVIITVRDEGPGVPDAHMTKLFEPFFRPEPERGRSTGGVGLGLAIARTCILACSGSIYATNLSPKGFAVVIELSSA